MGEWGVGEVCGKEVGYTVDDTCKHKGCNKEIDRGLSYTCEVITGLVKMLVMVIFVGSIS